MTLRSHRRKLSAKNVETREQSYDSGLCVCVSFFCLCVLTLCLSSEQEYEVCFKCFTVSAFHVLTSLAG